MHKVLSQVVLGVLGLAAAALTSPFANAQFSVGSPTTNWNALSYGPGGLGDVKGDQQTGQDEADIVGNTGSTTTSLPSVYTKLTAGTTTTNGTLAYRVRVGGDQNPMGYKAVVLIGLDANKDGKLDLFVGVDNSGQNDGIYIWKPATGPNISPATLSVDKRLPLKKYTETAANYHWGAVDSPSATSGVVLDPAANTTLRKDFNGATGTDYMLSFSVPFADVVAALAAQGIAITSSTPLAHVIGTSTQVGSFNQDLNGVSGNNSSTTPWATLGVLSQPVNGSGTVVNVAPVNALPASATANGSLAIAGVAVNDADGNLATVALTAVKGTMSVSLSGGAIIVGGANGSSSITLGGTQSQINAALATLGFSPASGYTGLASVTMISTDGGGLADQDVLGITVVAAANTAPIAYPDADTTHAGKAVTTYVIGNDVDADGNVLTITSATLTAGTGAISALSGNITYTPATTFVGTAVIAYTISDGRGGTSNSTLTVTVAPNAVPIAANDTLNANTQSTVFINVLGNDSDADGDALTITAASRVSGTGNVAISGNELQFDAPNSFGITVLSYTIADGYGGTATATVTITVGTNSIPVAVNDAVTTPQGIAVDADVLANDTDGNGDALTITDAVVTTGSGTALAVNNKVRFTPTPEFVGTAKITYTIDDGRGATATAVLTVTVIGNTAPIAVAESYTVAEDEVLALPAGGVLANDSDADGNALTAILVSSTTSGTLTLEANGAFTYTPGANFAGADSFTYKASDGALTSAQVTVALTVTPVNDAPVAQGESYTATQGSVLHVSTPGLLQNDSDAEGDVLKAVLVGEVSHGALSLNAGGSFLYLASGGFSGDDSFSYQVTDGSATSGVVVVTIHVAPSNSVPVATADEFAVESGAVLNVPAPGVVANDADAESDPLFAVLVSSASNGAVALNADGSFLYTPAAGFSGTDSFEYTVTDGSTTSGAAVVSIVVAAPAPPNTPPVISVANLLSTEVTVPLTFTMTTSDPDGDTVATKFLGPLQGTISGSGPEYVYQPSPTFAGTDTFKIIADDGRGGVATRTVKVNVTAKEATIGNYAMLLRNEQNEIAAHLFLTTTKLGRATGVLTIGGVRYTVRGFFGGAPVVIAPRSKGFTPITLAINVGGGNGEASSLVVTAIDGSGAYTGSSARSPYGPARRAPQAGRYTFVASRQQLVLDRTGAELADAERAVPMVASAMTARVTPNGAVIFQGSTGHGYALVCSSYMMSGSEVPFYAGRRNSGPSIQWGVLRFPAEAEAGAEITNAPAVSGTLHWNAGLDRRIPEPFAAEYPVLGARYLAPETGEALLNAASLTISLDIPSFAAAGAATYEETRSFSGNLLPPSDGSGVSAIRVNLSTGAFISRVQGRVVRPILGVIIQGEGIDRGLGSVVDLSSFGTCELRPAVGAPIAGESN